MPCSELGHSAQPGPSNHRWLARICVCHLQLNSQDDRFEGGLVIAWLGPPCGANLCCSLAAMCSPNPLETRLCQRHLISNMQACFACSATGGRSILWKLVMNRYGGYRGTPPLGPSHVIYASVLFSVPDVSQVADENEALLRTAGGARLWDWCVGCVWTFGSLDAARRVTSTNGSMDTYQQCNIGLTWGLVPPP